VREGSSMYLKASEESSPRTAITQFQDVPI
jgi:hypothetical protein